MLQSLCEDAVQVIEQYQPAWIVGFNGCMPEINSALAKQYTSKFSFGRQQLWSRIIPSAAQGVHLIDLTPLARELQPPRDGRSVDYPRNPYFPHVR